MDERDELQQLRTALKAAGVGLWDWDLRTGVVHYSSEWKRQLGYGDHELSDDFAEWRTRLHPEDRARAEATARAFVETPWPNFTHEFRLRHRDGSYRTILAQASLVHGDDGRPIRMLGSHIDVTEQRHAERVLAEREAVLALCIKHSPVPIAMFDRDMRYLATSDAWSLSYRVRQDLIGRCHYDVFPDLPARWKEVHRRVLAGATEQSERDAFEREDGQVDWVRWQARPWYEAGGEVGGIVIFSEVINDRVAAEAKERESDERLRQVMDAIPHGLILVDTDGKLLYSNQRFRESLGSDEQLRTGAERVALAHPDDRAALRAKMMAVFDPGATPETVEVRLRCTDGEYRAFTMRPVVVRDASGKPAYGISTITDDQERRTSQDALRRSEQLLRSVMDAVPHWILLVDAEGNTRYSNQYGRDHLGSDEALRTRAARLALVHPDDLEAANKKSVEFTFSGARVEAHEVRLRCKDGSYRWFTVRALPIVDDTGAVHEVVYSLTDEDARKSLLERLLAMQKMEAVGQLAGGVAHDFNNMLMVITAQAESIAEHPALPAAVREDLTDLQLAAARAAALTKQLLAFARRSTMALVAIELNQFVETTLNLVRRSLGVMISVDLVPNAQPLTVQVDPNMLTQVVLNLAVNARDAMPDGGRLTLRVSKCELDEQAARAFVDASAGTWACVSVSDSGCGMSEDVLRRIFEPFYTTKEVGKGTGLGLAMVQGILQQHRGFVTVSSRPGVGSEFRVHLPLLDTDAPMASAAEQAFELLGRGQTILLVEDEDSVRSLIERMLRRRGYHVITASNAQAAIQVFAAHADEIKVLLTDVTMPGGLSGTELASRLHAAKPSLQIVLTSGQSRDAVMRNVRCVAAVNFLQKPFATVDLMRLLDRLLKH